MPNEILEKSIRGVKYTISLPERFIRSLTALVGGVLKEASDFLVPAALKESTTYRIFIGNLLRYAVENIGRVEGAYPEDGKMDDEYAVRKTIGNGVEMVSIVAMSASPLWVLAFFSDALWGVNSYFKRIAEELGSHDFLEEKFRIEKKEDFLDSLQKLSDSLATNIDTPPLSKEELRNNYAELKEYFREIGLKTRLSLGEVKEMWSDMVRTAAEEKRSLLEISGAMTMHLMNRARSTGRSIKATGKVTADIIHEDILDYYRDALKDIHQQGYFSVVKQEYGPYLRSAATMFSPGEKMLTERIFSKEFIEFFGNLKEKGAERREERLAELDRKMRRRRLQRARKRRAKRLREAGIEESPDLEDDEAETPEEPAAEAEGPDEDPADPEGPEKKTAETQDPGEDTS